MQDIVAIASLLREISFGVLLAGLFYTFGMFALGRVFSILGEHEHDVDHDVDHDIDHDLDHDIDHGVEHEVDHDYDHDYDHDIEHDYDHDVGHDVDHDLDHDFDLDHGDIDHDLDHDVDHDVDHGVEHDADHDMEHAHDHDIDLDHDIDVDKSGWFEAERGAPLGVTIGTSLVSFGFIGSILYYDGIILPLLGKVSLHLIAVFVVVFSVRTVLAKAFVESGFNITPRHLVGSEVEAVSTVRDDFGEVRANTDMGLRRFLARPFQKGVIFQKGTKLFVVSADQKFVYVDPRKDVVKWLQKQSKTPPSDEGAE
jgi:hypothetical protein